jgi:ribonuclease HII
MSSLKAYLSRGIIEAGTDEAGRGCLAGPVVAAAVVMPPRKTHPLLNDSKKMTAKHREELFDWIKKNAKAWAIAEVDSQTIDEINILQASLLAMHKSLDKLSLKPGHILVDGNRFKPYPFTPHTCVIGGDGKYRSIAAASVLAKVHRDRLMEAYAEKYPGYGWEKNAGYGTVMHREGIQRLGVTPIHRMTFRLLPEK